MYRRILLPTDGSKLSDRALKEDGQAREDLLGSETAKVLLHSKIPVLVVRFGPSL
jgi:nucleotide-binding universal stress UspA family protein